MKIRTHLYRLFFLLAMALLAGCTSIASELDSKYVFTQLQQVEKFSNFNMQGWHAIDRQSLIVDASPKRKYLIILQRPIIELRSAEAIEITSTGRTVSARFDRVEVLARPHSISVGIQSIYKLEGKDDLKAAKAQIRKDR